MKQESLVIVDQYTTVNVYLTFVHTARHVMGEIYIWKFELFKLTIYFLTGMKS